MNYSKIKTLLEKRKITIQKLCDEVGISTVGFHNIYNNKSIKVQTLEKIADVLQVPIKYFFEDETSDNPFFVNESTVTYGDNNKILINKNNEIKELKNENELLKNALKDKEKIIKLLEKK